MWWRYVTSGWVQGNSASVGVVPGAIRLLHTQHVEPTNQKSNICAAKQQFPCAKAISAHIEYIHNKYTYPIYSFRNRIRLNSAATCILHQSYFLFFVNFRIWIGVASRPSECQDPSSEFRVPIPERRGLLGPREISLAPRGPKTSNPFC